MLPWHQYLLGILFIVAGMFHFRKPKVYERIIPPYIPAKTSVVIISGIAEMILGLMLMNKDSETTAAWGIIVLLLIFLPVHIYMLQDKKASLKLPKWILWVRLPLQFAMMIWAYQYI